MKSEFFTAIKDTLLELGFKETRLPWRMESDTHLIVQVEEDNPTVFSIEAFRYPDDTLFRGRLHSGEELKLILSLIY